MQLLQLDIADRAEGTTKATNQAAALIAILCVLCVLCGPSLHARKVMIRLTIISFFCGFDSAIMLIVAIVEMLPVPMLPNPIGNWNWHWQHFHIGNIFHLYFAMDHFHAGTMRIPSSSPSSSHVTISQFRTSGKRLWRPMASVGTPSV